MDETKTERVVGAETAGALAFSAAAIEAMTEGCFDGAVRRSAGRETFDRRDGADGWATGCRISAVMRAAEARLPVTGTVGASAGTFSASAAGDSSKAIGPAGDAVAAAVDALAGVAANAPAVAAAEAVTAAVGGSVVAAIVGLVAATVDSDAGLASGATAVASV